jgi:O-acetyl-ADP-ribose deacetylase (regulator of RNase III)
MAIIEEKHGNIMQMFKDKEATTIVHGCNCFGIMGAGLSRQVSAMYPEALDIDRGVNEKGEITTPVGDYNRLGTYSMYEIDGQRIINAYTQFEPGANFEYCALIDFLSVLNNDFSGETIVFPQIGCGIGGGTWSVVKQIIKEHTPDLEIIIVYYDNGANRMGQTTIDLES